MPATPHHCLRGGALVPAAEVVPEDASDYLWGFALGDLGCNHLRCSACGGAVSQDAQADGGRRNACGCASEVVYTRRHLDGQPADVMDGPPLEGFIARRLGPRAQLERAIRRGLPPDQHEAWLTRLATIEGLTP